MNIVKVDTLPDPLVANTVYFVKTTIGGETDRLQIVVTDENAIPFSTPNETDIENVIAQQ